VRPRRSAARAILQDAREQRLARALGQLEHLLEAFRAAEVRVGNLADAEIRDEVEEQTEVPCIRLRLQRGEIVQVATIHRQDPVESFEVLARNLPGPQARQVIAAPAPVQDRPIVGRLSHVPIADARRFDYEAIVHAGAHRVRAEHRLRRRRTADVAHANK